MNLINKYSKNYVKLLDLIPLVFLLIFSSCANKADVKTVSAAYVPAGYYLPFLVVEHDSLLKKYGYKLELKKFQDNSQMINSFINGNLDITAQSSFTMYPIEELHPGTFKFIYGQYNNSYFFVVPKDSKAKNLKDLKGKTIGIWKSPTAEAFVKILLKKEGLEYEKDYKIQRFPVSDIASAIENRIIDVLFGFDVPLANLVSTGKYRYLQPDAIGNLIPGRKIFNGGAFLNTQLIENNPDKAKIIQKAFFEALEVIHNNRKHAIEILAEKLGTSVDVASEANLDIFEKPNKEMLNSAFETYKLLEDNQIVKSDKFENKEKINNLFWLDSK